MIESDAYHNEYPTEEELHIKNTKLVGQFKHVIRLYYPCNMFEDVRGSHGDPPTMEKIATVFARHRNECTDGCHM